MGFSSCRSWALEPRLNSCAVQVELLCSTWDIPRRGIKPVSLVSPALAGGFITTESAGSSPFSKILKNWSVVDLQYCVSVRCEWSESRSVVSDSLWPPGLCSPWNSPGQNAGVGRLSHLQGIFPTQGLNPSLPHCRRILYQLSHSIVIQLHTHTHTHIFLFFFLFSDWLYSSYITGLCPLLESSFMKETDLDISMKGSCSHRRLNLFRRTWSEGWSWLTGPDLSCMAFLGAQEEGVWAGPPILLDLVCLKSASP